MHFSRFSFVFFILHQLHVTITGECIKYFLFGYQLNVCSIYYFAFFTVFAANALQRCCLESGDER